MTLPTDPAYPIANLHQILVDRVKIDLSPIELAEILWLAVQKSEGLVPENTPDRSIEPQAITDLRQQPDLEPLQSSGIPRQPTSEPIVNTVAEPLQPISEPIVNIVAEPSPDIEQTETAATPLPVKIPEAVALRNRREIAKMLRPLMRKIPSRTRQSIDEEATAIRIAEDKIWTPVVKPEPERWLELAIVVEVTSLFDVWRDSIAEFQHLMERHGAFRNVRTWQLQAADDGKPELFLQTATGLNRKPRSPRELLDAGGRRLVLLVSDCTSKAWRSGKIFQLLELWSRENPVTIAQLLPKRYWDRSALGLGHFVALHSQLPGARSRDWQVPGLSPRRRQRIQGGIKFPVVTIEPQSLGQWAQAMAAVGEQQTMGVMLRADIFSADRSATSGSEILTPKQLVQRFRGTASEKAQELVDMMAVLPVNWSVLRLLQKNLVQGIEDLTAGTGALYLAEIYLSGLLDRKVDADDNRSTVCQYDFFPGVRHVLLGGIPISEAQQVGEEIAKTIFAQLPAAVQARVNADIIRRWGESFRYFEAFLLPDLDWGDESAAVEMLPFAQVGGEVLRRWGGAYAALAEKLEQKRGLPHPDPILTDQKLVEPNEPFPELTTFEFDVAEFVESVTPLQRIPHQFDVATIEVREQRNFFGVSQSTPKIIINRQRKQHWQYLETLAPSLTLELVQIPAGSFMMGAESEAKSRDNERPQHLVDVPKFYLGKYPITQAQWKFGAGLPPIERELDPDPSRFKGKDLPVECVSWLNAIEFCARLWQHTGREYRLPSEAEWEYACRAGTTTPFHFGETIDRQLASYNGDYTYGRGQKGKYREKTTPVGSFKVANNFGLFDMHGNVWEWCQDYWHSSYHNAPRDASAWLDSESSETANRVLRGGSWYGYPGYCRSAVRYDFNPDDRSYYTGFRVVLPARTL